MLNRQIQTTRSSEEFSQLDFTAIEVLSTEEAIRKRKADLYRAMILGNVYHRKCTLVVSDGVDLSRIETLVWAATENFVTIKGGEVIPVKSIKEIII